MTTLMKNRTILAMLFFIATLVSFSSCNSTQRLTVHGTPGTVVASPDGQKAIIDQNGKATLTMDRTADNYPHFLLSKAPNSNVWVPFALDYKDHKRGFTAASAIFMYTLSMGGSLTLAAMAISGVEGAAILIPSIAAIGGLAVGVPLAFKVNYTVDYSTQSTNNDLIQ